MEGGGGKDLNFLNFVAKTHFGLLAKRKGSFFGAFPYREFCPSFKIITVSLSLMKVWTVSFFIIIIFLHGPQNLKFISFTCIADSLISFTCIADSVMITSGALHKDSFDKINTYLKAFPHFFKF